MPNIKFNYLYRDAGNYKNFNSVIFDNPQNIEFSAVEALIRSKLIPHHWFYADQWHVPDLHFGIRNNELDHTFHEFENVEYTDDEVNGEMDLVAFIKILKSISMPNGL